MDQAMRGHPSRKVRKILDTTHRFTNGVFQQFGIALGDLALLSYREKTAFAIIADVGPANKIGERSITREML